MSKDYREDIKALIASQNKVKVCPFDGLPCKYVDSCDDVLSLQLGVDVVEEESCSRARFRRR